MKKILALSLVASSIFSMELAYNLQKKYNYPNFARTRFAKVAKIVKEKKIQTPDISSTISNSTVSNLIDEKKVQIAAFSVYAPHRFGNIELYHGKKGFVILQGDKKHVIEKRFIDPIARSITKERLKPFLKSGYFAINQTNDGCFTLKAHQRLKGGGPVLGTVMYWLTKSVCYGVALAGVTTVAVTTGGTAVLAVTGGAAAAGGLAVGTTAAVTTTTTAIASTAGIITAGTTAGAVVSGGATIIGGALANAGAAAVAAEVTVGVVTSAGGIGATIAGVESLSVAVGTFFGMLPTI